MDPNQPPKKPSFLKRIIPLFFIFILLLVMSVLVAFGVKAFKNPKTEVVDKTVENIHYTSTQNAVDVENTQIKQIIKSPKDNIFVTGWIPDWDFVNGTESVKSRSGTFNGISPVWFYLNEDGSLQGTYYTNNLDFIQYCQQNNIELIPTVALFDADTLSKSLNSPENYKRQIDEIMQNVTDNNYAGIDLDYESTLLADKKLFFQFMTELSQKLHAVNKKLVFTLLPKWGDEITYPTLPQTRRVQDYKEIADLVDEFRIMTYDYTGRSAAEIGPIAPLSWMELVIQYTIYIGIPRDKIVLGIHDYAYDWSDRPITQKVDPISWFGNLTQVGEPADALFYEDIESIITNYGMQSEFNSDWVEAIGRYDYHGQQRVVVYANDQAIELRKQLAKDYGIKGVSYWRIGGEGALKL